MSSLGTFDMLKVVRLSNQGWNRFIRKKQILEVRENDKHLA